MRKMLTVLLLSVGCADPLADLPLEPSMIGITYDTLVKIRPRVSRQLEYGMDPTVFESYIEALEQPALADRVQYLFPVEKPVPTLAAVTLYGVSKENKRVISKALTNRYGEPQTVTEDEDLWYTWRPRKGIQINWGDNKYVLTTEK